jgi:hypothetical protein
VQQPAHAGVGAGAAAEHGFAQRQQLGRAVAAGRVEPEHASVVGVADIGQVAADVAHRAQKAQRALQRGPVGARERLAAGLADQAGNEQEFGRKHVVGKGLLAVDAVARKLRQRFVFELAARLFQPGL